MNRPGFSGDSISRELWHYEQGDEILPGDPGTGGADGVGAPGGIRRAVGSDRFDCGKNWLHNINAGKWFRQAERDQGRRANLTRDDREWLNVLVREHRELKRVNQILRKTSAFCPDGARSQTEEMIPFIVEHRDS